MEAANKRTTNIKIPVRVHAALKAYSLRKGYKLEFLVEQSIRDFLEGNLAPVEAHPAAHKPHAKKEKPVKEVVEIPKVEQPIPEPPRQSSRDRNEEIRRQILKEAARRKK